MTNLEFQGTKSVVGDIIVPGDKSISHRSIILGAISAGDTRIRGFLEAEDTLNTLHAFEECGVGWRREEDAIIIEGRGKDNLREPTLPVDMGNSGTGMRLLAGLFSGLDMFVVLTGDSSLRTRPMGRIRGPLLEMGAKIDGRENGRYAPLAIRGGSLTGIQYEMPVASAQLKSALLLAGLWAEGETWIREPGPARNHTEIMLDGFGAKVLYKENGWIGVKGKQGDKLEGRDIHVPGDMSSAAFFIVAALIAPEGELTIRDVGVNSTRTGIVDILRGMGACVDMFNEKNSGGETRADITVKSGSLKACAISGDQIVRTIDEFPVLAVAGAYAEGDTVVSGAEELRVKESDRIATITSELSKMGAEIEEKPDGMVIHGGKPLTGAPVDSHGDHRIAMALAVAALGAEGKTVIQNTDCIATSFPGFEKLIKEVTRV